MKKVDTAMTEVYSWKDVELFVKDILPHLELMMVEEKEFFAFFNDLSRRPLEDDKYLFDLIRHIVDVFYGVHVDHEGEIRTHFVDNPNVSKEDLIKELSEFETKFKSIDWGENLMDRVIKCYYNFKVFSKLMDAKSVIDELYD